MFSTRQTSRRAKSAEAVTPELDVSSLLDSITADVDVEVEVDVDVDEVTTQKPHFLDYDAVPPPDFEERFDKVLSFGIGAKTEPPHGAAVAAATSSELYKMDKKYERDGEISDCELASSGYTKKEFTQDDNTLHMISASSLAVESSPRKSQGSKHFLDENPIPPDYMLEREARESREHSSLDRSFERQYSREQARTASPATSLDGGVHSKRKGSLDRSSAGTHSSREKCSESSYTLSRFLDNDVQLVSNACSLSSHQRRLIPSGVAWTNGMDSHYSSLQMSSPNNLDRLGPKVECVYSLLSMLGSNDPLEMSKKFLELSRTPETCQALRRAGCVPLLVQMMHSEGDEKVRKWASAALHNVVHSNADEKAGRREAKVLRLLDQILDYCNFLKTLLQSGGEAIADDSDRHPLAAISSLMKVSFDEEHRHAMCELGALQVIPSLVHLDHAVHGPKPEGQCCNSLRRYALMALTNLTFGDENNKALLCSQKPFMEALVAQLDSAPDDLLQVTASVLRNLSWRADSNMKAVLNEIGTVTALAHAAMKNRSENTLKAILSALWNLSAHCSTNKAEFCAVEGALAFLVDMLTYEGPSKTLKIIENAGGILRNVSSHIAVREHYRQILRERNCLAILLQQLKSESLTVVSNSCGTLWNLSARCPEDQKFLWDNGAVPMLRSLINSKHAMISEGSSSALKNLLNFRPALQNQDQFDDPIARSMRLKKLPTLNVRKQKALELQLGEKEHAETCDNLDIGPSASKEHTTPFETASSTASVSASAAGNSTSLFVARRYPGAVIMSTMTTATTTARLTRSAMLTKSESRDSIFSAKSDSAYENLMRSHSAADASRSNSSAQKQLTYNVTIPRHNAFTLENDVEPTEEQPIDYSVKYSENSTKTVGGSVDLVNEGEHSQATATYTTYQETDLDQPTDFSLRYAENQIESDVDALPQEARANGNEKQSTNSNEILLILEDSVKCYQTEDTPYVISNAASVTDLRQTKSEHLPTEPAKIPTSSTKYRQRALSQQQQAPNSSVTYGSGSYTPEKPVNYCEEGTPGYFSRYDSLSSLEEAQPQVNANQNLVGSEKQSSVTTTTTPPGETEKTTAAPSGVLSGTAIAGAAGAGAEGVIAATNPAVVHATGVNSAQETPLMFSRHSSMDSLVEEDIGPCDDKSSVVSDFSRLASGVISPSELPDSPTQSMPQSPRRNSTVGGSAAANFTVGVGALPIGVRGNFNGPGSTSGSTGDRKRPLRSVFEDNLNTFHVENTPAQFSCATSLSNLSILDEEPSTPPTAAGIEETRQPAEVAQSTKCSGKVEMRKTPGNTISEGEEEEEEGTNNDDLLLASCINMGMNRATPKNKEKTGGIGSSAVQLQNDEAKQYCTEDTPALRSKVGSNTNLSAISICSSSNEHRDGVAAGVAEDMSSNASESGVTTEQTIDLLQQCIRDGMPKAQTTAERKMPSKALHAMDPIAMMRRGGSALPPYLPVSDEMNKYLVENSPCTFSVMSGLSNLTVGSSLVGPAVKLKETEIGPQGSRSIETGATILREATAKGRQSAQAQHKREDVRREPQWQEDSLSSLSLDSEDDTNLLSQAIAAGCNRPKSNLGFNTPTPTSKRSTSLSASQPISINSAASASSLNSRATVRHYQRQHQNAASRHDNGNGNGNESFSSVDSSDSNDNQSKSLLELCILTGMHGSREQHNSRKQHLLSGRSKNGNVSSNSNTATATQSNPNLKQCDIVTGLSPYQSTKQQPLNRHLRERDRKDEKLLLECINTGITRKIGGGTGGAGDSLVRQTRGELPFVHNASMPVPKNVPATSAAALEHFRPLVDTTSQSVQRTAAPGVEKNCGTFKSSPPSPSPSSSPSNNNSYTHTRPCTTTTTKENGSVNGNASVSVSAIGSTSTNTNLGDITNGLGKTIPRSAQTYRSTAVLAASPPSPVSTLPEMLTNGIGCRELDSDTSQSISLEQIASDESNQSFIMETTISLENTQLVGANESTVQKANDKHKDPDLMLKSVERLTMEFVTSAEQLRTNGSSESTTNGSGHRRGSYSVGGSNSYNTWNEDTCPNDVSFPSVSVSAPVMASFKHDSEDDGSDEDQQATEADHREFHDFAEITPTNDEQPAPSLECAAVDLDFYSGTQPNSLGTETETETETLVRGTSECSYITAEVNSSSGLNFKLGGEVQTAAVAGNHVFLQHSSMTSSAIIAFEARALADNLNTQQQECVSDRDHGDLSFSCSSLDLDNVRPPSGMESLNISEYYQDLSAQFSPQPHSLPSRNGRLPQSPQLLSSKSPKFPRKSLPPGLVARRALGQLPAHLAGSAESVNSSCNQLLDNIKPPSLMDELLDSMISVESIQSEVADCESLATTVSVSNYETAAAGAGNDFDDNTMTLQSCCDATLPRDKETLGDGDGSTHSGTPLPSDGEFSSAESTPLKSPATRAAQSHKRTLTPKQKRQTASERYKTYTIMAEAALSDEQRFSLEQAQQDEILEIEIVSTATSAAAMNMVAADENEGMSLSPTTVARAGNKSRASRRRASQDRYRTQTIVYAACSSLESHGSNELSTDDCPSEEVSSIRAMTERFKFISAPLPPASLGTVLCTPPVENDYVSLECEQNSETESCHGMCSDGSDVEDRQNGEGGQSAQPEKGIRARIIKPGEVECETVEVEQEHAAAKATAVRGRKKPPYVSPYSKHFQQQRNSPSVTAGTAVNKRAVVGSVNNPQFRQRNGLRSTVKQSTDAKSEPKKESGTESLPPLERQGTFVQDEPTIAAVQVPVVDTAPTSQAGSAQSSPTRRISKLPTKQRTTPTAAKTVIPATVRKSPNIRRTTATAAAAAPQRSNSNANIRVTSTAARIAVLATRVSATTPPSRSNSNLSGGAAAAVAASRITQAQSRIAGIWKRVDEARAKQNQQPAQRTQRIARKPPQSQPQPRVANKQQLVRSATFDQTPDAAKPGNNVPTTTTAAATAKTTKIVSSRSTSIATRNRELTAAVRK